MRAIKIKITKNQYRTLFFCLLVINSILYITAFIAKSKISLYVHLPLMIVSSIFMVSNTD